MSCLMYVIVVICFLRTYLSHFAHLSPAPSFKTSSSVASTLAAFHSRLHSHGIPQVFRSMHPKYQTQTPATTKANQSVPVFKTPRGSGFHISKQGCSYNDLSRCLKRLGL